MLDGRQEEDLRCYVFYLVFTSVYGCSQVNIFLPDIICIVPKCSQIWKSLNISCILSISSGDKNVKADCYPCFDSTFTIIFFCNTLLTASNKKSKAQEYYSFSDCLSLSLLPTWAIFQSCHQLQRKPCSNCWMNMTDLKQCIWNWCLSGNPYLWDYDKIREIEACPGNQIAILKEAKS